VGEAPLQVWRSLACGEFSRVRFLATGFSRPRIPVSVNPPGGLRARWGGMGVSQLCLSNQQSRQRVIPPPHRRQCSPSVRPSAGRWGTSCGRPIKGHEAGRRAALPGAHRVREGSQDQGGQSDGSDAPSICPLLVSSLWESTSGLACYSDSTLRVFE